MQFYPIDKQKFLKSLNQDGTKGFNRQDTLNGTTQFGCSFFDFFNILSIVERSSIENPFYKEFMVAFEKFRLPTYKDCLIWIWIIDS